MLTIFFYARQNNEDMPDEDLPGAAEFSLSDPADGMRCSAAGIEAVRNGFLPKQGPNSLKRKVKLI